MTVSNSAPIEGEPPRGLGLASCAVVFGILALLGAYPAHRLRAKIQQTKCSSRLRDVHIAAEQYAGLHGSYPYAEGDWEATIDLLQESGCLSYRPECAHWGEGGFEGFLRPLVTGLEPAVPLAWDKDPHGAEGRVVRFTDQSVRHLGQAEFTELMKAPRVPLRQSGKR